MGIKITDLEKFVLEQIYRPYAINLTGKRIDRLTTLYNLETAIKWLETNNEWHDLVMGRIKRIDFYYPYYIKHPLIDYIKKESRNENNQETTTKRR